MSKMSKICFSAIKNVLLNKLPIDQKITVIIKSTKLNKIYNQIAYNNMLHVKKQKISTQLKNFWKLFLNLLQLLSTLLILSTYKYLRTDIFL